MKKIIALFLMICMLGMLLVSCGNGAAINEGDGYYRAEDEWVSESLSDSVKPGTSENTSESVATDEKPVDDRKIIKTYNLSLETKKFAQDSAFIVSKAEELGGYIANSSVSGNRLSSADGGSQSARYTVRIPAASLDAYIAALSEACNVYSSSLTTEDITDSYYGIQAQLDSLVLQEKKLNDMLAAAKSVQDMITIDNKLTSVRAEINALNYRLQNMDKSVNYSYVYITLTEVREYHKEEKTYFQELGEAIFGSLENFVNVLGDIVLVFVWVLPFGITLSAIVLLIVFLERRSKKRRLKKQQKENKE